MISLRLRSGTVLLWAALACCVSAACKRQRAPELEDIWDDNPAPEQTEAIANLAPPWPTPARALLDNGLLAYWLHEAGTPAMHVRLMVPTTAREEPVGAEAAWVAMEYLRHELQRRLSSSGVTVQIDHAPGRIELVIHGGDEDRAGVLRWLGWALSRPEPEQALLRARDRVGAALEAPRTFEVAATLLTARLLALPPSIERTDAAQLRGLSGEDLVDAFVALTHPRHAVLAIHAGHAVKDARDDLLRLAETWRGRGRKKTPPAATARLRAPIDTSPKGYRLLAEPPAPLLVSATAAQGGPVLLLGRVIPTPTPAERGLVRLAQRLIQEELDVRVVISGQHAVVVVEVPLSPGDPDRSAQKAVDTLSELAQTRYQSQHLFQAAQMWLGARVVQASLDGEDWTALWSLSIDLADDDAAIVTALASHAKAMLAPDPDVLLTWQKNWLDPKRGQVGWQWVVTGADDALVRRLSRVGNVQPAP